MDSTALHASLQAFADAVKTKITQVVPGEREDQLRGPFDTFMKAAARTWDWEVVCTGETRLPDGIGRPDFAIHLNGLLAGYAELKAPGAGATASRFRGRNRDQFKRFSVIPNILYTDGNEWALYRSGELVGEVVQLSGNVDEDGNKAATYQDAHDVGRLLHNFLSWEPFLPRNRLGKINFQDFAAMLASLCRLLRDDVTDALKHPDSPLAGLKRDWQQLLFPNASDDQFADAYAQTVTFALLLGRSESFSDTFTLESAASALVSHHSLLERALHILTDPRARNKIKASLDLLVRVIAVVPPTELTAPNDLWLHFYEHFLAVYDSKLRKEAGVYYTPVQVVRTQVRLIDDLLVHRLGKPLGFADPNVVTLDPAVGTGTYLLGVIEHALGRIEAEQGAGAVDGQATALAENLYGFEQMVGAYSVAELRVSRALREHGAQLPSDGTHIYLTDTLESPQAEAPQAHLFQYQLPIAEQHARALKVKNTVPVIVCLGNPPYGRHESVTRSNKARTGGWVRWGDSGERAILHDFRAPVIDAGNGHHVKNLYNLYVYFWRWALWKVFEHQTAHGPGVISFISASSYLYGAAFGGMRKHLRQQCDEIWILDLGGEGRGARKNENIFAIQTPVAIAVAVRVKEAKQDTPATVRYARIEGTREEKLAVLDDITCFSAIDWQDCPADWQARFLPPGRGAYFDWPLLTDLMPWQHSGSQLKRTWPIAPAVETLEYRWRALLQADKRSEAFRETRDRNIHSKYRSLFEEDTAEAPIAQLPEDTPTPRLQRYAYRSFDRQWMLADTRLGDYLRPALWRTYSDRQVYVTSLLTSFLGAGPALTACAMIPDLHHFRGSYGAKDTIPLYRTTDASQANILPGLLEALSAEYQRTITPEDFLAYVYGALAHPAFTERFATDLETQELRVPITKDAALFERVRAIGARLLWLHTYGERFVPKGKQHGRVPSGTARCIKAVPGDADRYPDSFTYTDATCTLHVGGGAFAPVESEIYKFEVSGLKVVQSWLKYRMRKGAGRKSSPLDGIRPVHWSSTFTTELLELLWVLESTVALYPTQENLLKAIIEETCFQDDDLPPVPDNRRKPPRAPSTDTLPGMNEEI